jgi:nicotinamidase-related amidase
MAQVDHLNGQSQPIVIAAVLANSAFFGTDLDSILKRSSCSQLIVAGINTHACIRATVVDAYQRDIDVLLARDCIDSYDEEHDRVTWRYMNGKLGRGLTNQELIEILRGPRSI